MSANLAAEAISKRLGGTFPDVEFKVTTDLMGRERERVIVQWFDLPTSDVVYHLAHAATDGFTTAQRGWKLVLRNWPSREMRIRARTEIRRIYPSFDHITPDGDINPDSTFRFRNMQIVVGDVLVSDEKGSADRFVKMVAYELLRQGRR